MEYLFEAIGIISIAAALTGCVIAGVHLRQWLLHRHDSGMPWHWYPVDHSRIGSSHDRLPPQS